VTLACDKPTNSNRLIRHEGRVWRDQAPQNPHERVAISDKVSGISINRTDQALATGTLKEAEPRPEQARRYLLREMRSNPANTCKVDQTALTI